MMASEFVRRLRVGGAVLELFYERGLAHYLPTDRHAMIVAEVARSNVFPLTGDMTRMVLGQVIERAAILHGVEADQVKPVVPPNGFASERLPVGLIGAWRDVPKLLSLQQEQAEVLHSALYGIALAVGLPEDTEQAEVEGLSEMERVALASQQRVRELERQLAEIQRKQGEGTEGPASQAEENVSELRTVQDVIESGARIRCCCKKCGRYEYLSNAALVKKVGRNRELSTLKVFCKKCDSREVVLRIDDRLKKVSA